MIALCTYLTQSKPIILGPVQPDPTHEIERALDVHDGRSSVHIYTSIHTPFIVSLFLFYTWPYVRIYASIDPQYRLWCLLLKFPSFCFDVILFFLWCWVHQVYYCLFALHIKQSLIVELVGSSHGKRIMIFSIPTQNPCEFLSTAFPFFSSLLSLSSLSQNSQPSTLSLSLSLSLI